MQPLSRRTLTDRVAQAVLDEILERNLKEGDALPSTRALAHNLEVSVVVVREALAALAGRGIVSRRQGRESVVAKPGPDVLDSIFRVRRQQDAISLDEFQQCRGALELQSVALAAGSGSPHDRARALSPLVEEMQATTALEALVDADERFHHQIAELSGNRAIALLLSSVHSTLRESIGHNWEIVTAQGAEAELHAAVEKHADIAKAVIQGDHARAISAMASHFAYWSAGVSLEDLVQELAPGASRPPAAASAP